MSKSLVHRPDAAAAAELSSSRLRGQNRPPTSPRRALSTPRLEIHYVERLDGPRMGGLGPMSTHRQRAFQAATNPSTPPQRSVSSASTVRKLQRRQPSNPVPSVAIKVASWQAGVIIAGPEMRPPSPLPSDSITYVQSPMSAAVAPSQSPASQYACSLPAPPQPSESSCASLEPADPFVLIGRRIAALDFGEAEEYSSDASHEALTPPAHWHDAPSLTPTDDSAKASSWQQIHHLERARSQKVIEAMSVDDDHQFLDLLTLLHVDQPQSDLETRASFIIRELLRTEMSYCGHLEALKATLLRPHCSQEEGGRPQADGRRTSLVAHLERLCHLSRTFTDLISDAPSIYGCASAFIANEAEARATFNAWSTDLRFFTAFVAEFGKQRPNKLHKRSRTSDGIPSEGGSGFTTLQRRMSFNRLPIIRKSESVPARRASVDVVAPLAPPRKPLSLADIIVMPLQRACRYQLFLSELLKCTSFWEPAFVQLSCALQGAQELARACDAKVVLPLVAQPQ